MERDGQHVLITHIRATGIAIRLRRVPVGFYVAVETESGAKRTSNTPASVNKDLVEWENEIALPLDRSSSISLSVCASFELGPTLGGGEVLHRFETTVGELLDGDGQLEWNMENSDEVDSSRSSFEIKIERRVHGQNEHVSTSDPPEPEEMRQLEDLTDRGHCALTRYRVLREQRDLDESIKYFELSVDQCPSNHRCRGTVLFNLATAKLIYCRVNYISPDLDVPINLLRDVLRLRPYGHLDHPSTLLSLATALKARSQRQHDEGDRAESEGLLSQVLVVAAADSYVRHAAALVLGSAAEPELIQPTENFQTTKNELDNNGKVQRLDAALQWIFHRDACKNEPIDHLGILFCIKLHYLDDLGDPDESISTLELILPFTSDDHPDKRSWLDDLSVLLWTRYERFWNRVDMEKSISIFEDGVQCTPDSHPDKPFRLTVLGTSLSTRYKRFGDIADLERSISLREDALRLTPDGHLDKPAQLNNLGCSLLARYKRFGSVGDLERSISLTEDALQSTPDGHPDRPGHLNNLCNSLSTRYERFGDLIDLERLISLREDVLQSTPDGHRSKPLWLNNLGDSLLIRYERLGDIVDLERSISLVEDAVKFTDDGHPNKSFCLSNLGHSLLTRYNRCGDIADLDRSISHREDALRFTPNGHPFEPTRLSNLARSLTTRYERSGDIADLKRSISLTENALQSTPDSHPEKSRWFNNLANLLSTRYERFGDIVDLERSISLFEDAVKFLPDDHPEKPLRLNNLGNSLLTRYQRCGDIADLERSIPWLKDAVRFTPDGHPDKPFRLSNLSQSWSTRYNRFGDIIDLDRSISLADNVVQLTPDGHTAKPARLHNLGRLLLARYKRFADLVDLERSVSLCEDAVQLTPDGHSDVPSQLDTLSHSMLARYKHLGDVTDLEKSISLGENAVQSTPDGHPDKPAWLNNLSVSYSIRYERFRDSIDLQRSISALESVVKLTPDGNPDKPTRLNNLGHSLLARYERLGGISDLERSITLFEDALQCIPDGHPVKPLQLSNLSQSLSTRYTRIGNVVDLERSISLTEHALQLTPDGHPDKPLRLNNLGGSLLSRYQRFGDKGDLEKSISILEDAVQFTPDGHPDKLKRLASLAVSFAQRFQRSGDLSNSDLSRAISCSSSAARSFVGSSVERFGAFQLWVRFVRHDSRSLLDAYTVAVDLLPQLAWTGLSLRDRYHQLLEAADVTCEAAAAALEVHEPDLAVEWLEQGRSIVWSQFSQLRTPVDDLRTVSPELAAQFERVSRELEHASTRDRIVMDEFTNHSDTQGGTLEKEARQYHALAVSRERLLVEIRALPCFERFLLPKTIRQLSPLACSGPVVFLNASKRRCDALVVMTGSERVVHIPLSNTSYDEIEGMRLQLNKLLTGMVSNRDVSHDDASDRGARVRGMSPDDVFKSILPYLWEKVVGPILQVLALPKSGEKLPRIFWCPTGPLSFLPIHAAGTYSTANPGPKLSDFAISSYIPTMSALELPLQGDPEAPSRNIRLLAVPQPSTDGQVHLTNVRGEIEIIRKLASSSASVDFQEADGTVKGVLSKMKETDWVHFACHGTQDRTNPYDSGFLLAHGERLKLPAIARLSRPHGGFAFLSACHTATGDEQLSEEAIHIAAGMLLAGYRGVIATMWSIMDNDAPRVSEDVYNSLFGAGDVPNSRQAAEALHDAIERLRDSGASFLSWVPFIHVGL